MYDFPCDWKAGFVMDPTKKQRVGYLSNFSGLGLPADQLKADIQVFTPYNVDKGETNYKPLAIKDDKVTVVGVLESFSWGGGVGDPVCISAYLSQENAMQLKGLMKMTLRTTAVSSFAWWIANFDEEDKAWFDEAHPLGEKTVAGQLNAPGKTDIRLAVASEPVKVAPNIDVNVYNVYFEVVPAANSTYDFHFANSKNKKFVKRWGLKVGELAKAAMEKAGAK